MLKGNSSALEQSLCQTTHCMFVCHQLSGVFPAQKGLFFSPRGISGGEQSRG